MSTKTWAGWYFSASHRDPMSGELHGHTWEVEAAWQGEPYRDNRALQETLKGILAVWDHTVLPDALASGEAIAQAIGSLIVDCAGVNVSRPSERLRATWRP